MNQREFFDRHAHRWDNEQPQDLGPRLKRVVLESRARLGDTVLDVGTGTGVLIPYLLEAVGPQGWILAIDISAEMLTVAQAKSFPPNVTLKQADIHNTGLLSNTFDCVICNAAFPHFENKELALSEMIRLLCPGRWLVISHPIGREAVNNLHRSVGEVVTHDRVPSAKHMKEMLENAGLLEVHVTDESDYYSAVGRKPLDAA